MTPPGPTPGPTRGPILAATDFSPPARHAADRAARLARGSAAPLVLVHVLPAAGLRALRQWLGDGHAMARHLQDDAQQQLGALASQLHAQRQVAVQTAARSGSVVDEIEHEAAARAAGLLVIGARGSGLLRRLVLGSTAGRLLRHTGRPVLVVRQKPQAPYRRVLVALDFSPWSVQALALAHQVAPHARLVLLHAYAVPFQEKLHFAGVDAATIDAYRVQARAAATQRVHAFAAAAGLAPSAWQPCIVEQEQAQDGDLVVMGRQGQSAAESLLLGSVSQHVLAEGSTDVLVATAPAAPPAGPVPAAA